MAIAAIQKIRAENTSLDLSSFKQMVDDMPVAVMICELQNFTITYMNESSLTALRSLEHVLPVKADQLLGQSIDIFHKSPEHQRNLLRDPKNLPHQAKIQVGDEWLDLLVTALRDERGNYVAPMLTWSIITEKVKADAESYRLEQMVANMPVNVMMLELENFTITYANETSITTLKTLEHLLPVKAEDLVGQCVDIFHKDPSFQRGLLRDPKNLPHKAHIQVGDEILDLLQALCEQHGKTIVMVTHDPRAADRAKRTLYLDKGVLQKESAA